MMITKMHEPFVTYTGFNRIPLRGDKGVLSLQFEYNFSHNDKSFEFVIQNDLVAYAGRKGEVIIQGCTSKFNCETDGKMTAAELYKLHVMAISHLKAELHSIGEWNPVFAKKIYPPASSLVNSQLQRFVDLFLRQPDMTEL
ncbi:MAG: hypothetical protein EOP53_22785 [Sphingobacteriales bacterium]|nr:MAG: hypothetical protein EOP53_22785 [Sphingobacteriales bacterium]